MMALVEVRNSVLSAVQGVVESLPQGERGGKRKKKQEGAREYVRRRSRRELTCPPFGSDALRVSAAPLVTKYVLYRVDTVGAVYGVLAAAVGLSKVELQGGEVANPIRGTIRLPLLSAEEANLLCPLLVSVIEMGSAVPGSGSLTQKEYDRQSNSRVLSFLFPRLAHKHAKRGGELLSLRCLGDSFRVAVRTVVDEQRRVGAAAVASTIKEEGLLPCLTPLPGKPGVSRSRCAISDTSFVEAVRESQQQLTSDEFGRIVHIGIDCGERNVLRMSLVSVDLSNPEEPMLYSMSATVHEHEWDRTTKASWLKEQAQVVVQPMQGSIAEWRRALERKAERGGREAEGGGGEAETAYNNAAAAVAANRKLVSGALWSATLHKETLTARRLDQVGLLLADLCTILYEFRGIPVAQRLDPIIYLGRARWHAPKGATVVASPQGVIDRYFAQHYLTVMVDENMTSWACILCGALLIKADPPPGTRKHMAGRCFRCANCTVTIRRPGGDADVVVPRLWNKDDTAASAMIGKVWYEAFEGKKLPHYEKVRREGREGGRG
jgi:hypothetical protein